MSEDANGWRLIESAPKDGTLVWLFWPECSPDFQQMPGRWEENPFSGECYWMDAADNEQSEPTYWRPLPPPPSSVS